MKNLRWLAKEWKRNHRHHGGVGAFARCAAGSLRLHLMPETASSAAGEVEAVTFSVVPGMTALWSLCIERALRASSSDRILIGDCSGGFIPLREDGRAKVIPLLNALHGPKLDLFFAKVCRAEFVIVSDDDVFWLDDAVWPWALKQFERDERTAVVSLIPRAFTSSVLRDKIAQPMGSYCLIVRREIWLREKLSFEIVYPPREAGYDWFYDTGDYANLHLLERGYRIVIAPPEIQKSFMALDGTSTWTLKIQENAGKIRPHLMDDLQVRPAKALRAVYALRGMAELTERFFPSNGACYLVRPEYLQTAEEACFEFLSSERRGQIRLESETRLAALAGALEKL